jgi:putative heme transporter
VKITGVLLSIALAGVLLIVLLPRALHVDWASTAHEVTAVPLADVALLVVVWLAGLGVHSITLRQSLPGLSVRHALALNLGGSSVSNLLPLGGAAGIGLNYAMLRSWGYDRVQITAFTAVSNLVVALVKGLVAAGGIVALTCMPRFATHWTGLGRTLTISLYAVGGVLLMAAVACCHRRVNGYLRQRLGKAVGRLWRQCAHVLKSGWRGLMVGGVGYPLLQVALLWSCLVALHANVGITAVLAAYAIERTLTLIPITPGGIGVVETAAAAVLVGFGADPVKAAAGVLLFRIFSFLLEIPVGAVVVAAWFARHRLRPKVGV